MCGRMISIRTGGNYVVNVYYTYCDLRQGGYGWVMYANLPDGRELYAEVCACEDDRADVHDMLWDYIVDQASALGIGCTELADVDWEV